MRFRYAIRTLISIVCVVSRAVTLFFPWLEFVFHFIEEIRWKIGDWFSTVGDHWPIYKKIWSFSHIWEKTVNKLLITSKEIRSVCLGKPDFFVSGNSAVELAVTPICTRASGGKLAGDNVTQPDLHPHQFSIIIQHHQAADGSACPHAWLVVYNGTWGVSSRGGTSYRDNPECRIDSSRAFYAMTDHFCVNDFPSITAILSFRRWATVAYQDENYRLYSHNHNVMIH